ncbi:MAG: hypothetical protein HWE18_01150 [Gammaproteobacteria bacterium]|nr:hypothetical protein [Gammaproteobacteria bacterium]
MSLVRTCVRITALMMLSSLMAVQANETSKENGTLAVQLSTFHEFRGHFVLPYQDADRVDIRSKMSGAYDVAIRFILDKAELEAQFDLVTESMVLDGHNHILKDDEKQLLGKASQALSQFLQKEYDEEFPEHSFLAVQMLAYWSKAPKDFAIGRREIHTR